MTRIARGLLAALSALGTAALPVAAAPGPGPGPAAAGGARAVEIHGHRGARGLAPENTLPAFARALAVGVTAIELDVMLSRDGVVVVAHDLVASALLYRDTTPATPRDPDFPYVGKPVSRLTLRQLKQLDCGTRRPPDRAKDPFVATQLAAPGESLPTLEEVFARVARAGNGNVWFTIELKVDPTAAPGVSPDPTDLTRRVVKLIKRHRLEGRVTLQSFDWRVLREARRLLPDTRRAALIDAKTARLGQPGPSPWLDGIDLNAAAYAGDLAAAAVAAGAQVLAPTFKFVDRALVDRAHGRGLLVIPWTVNEPQDIAAMLDDGVDGIITDFPDRVRDVLARRQLPLPPACE